MGTNESHIGEPWEVLLGIQGFILSALGMEMSEAHRTGPLTPWEGLPRVAGEHEQLQAYHSAAISLRGLPQ